MEKRTFFIGDVHGCYDELMNLVEKIGLCDEDDLYFVWDLINKWPKSHDVIEYVMNRPNTYSIKGNHEFFSTITPTDIDGLMYLTDKQRSWLINALPEYAESTWDLSRYHDWLSSLPLIIEEERFILVHGGIHPDFWLSTPPEIATMLRMHDARPWYEYYTGDKLIIYGHWAAEWLRVRANTIWLDTGCCFGGALTAYCLETHEFYQVRANAVYKTPAHWKNENPS